MSDKKNKPSKEELTYQKVISLLEVNDDLRNSSVRVLVEKALSEYYLKYFEKKLSSSNSEEEIEFFKQKVAFYRQQINKLKIYLVGDYSRILDQMNATVNKNFKGNQGTLVKDVNPLTKNDFLDYNGVIKAIHDSVNPITRFFLKNIGQEVSVDAFGQQFKFLLTNTGFVVWYNGQRFVLKTINILKGIGSCVITILAWIKDKFIQLYNWIISKFKSESK